MSAARASSSLNWFAIAAVIVSFAVAGLALQQAYSVEQQLADVTARFDRRMADSRDRSGAERTPAPATQAVTDLAARIRAMETDLAELQQAPAGNPSAGAGGTGTPGALVDTDLPAWERWTPERARTLERLAREMQALQADVAEIEGRPTGPVDMGTGNAGGDGEDDKPTLDEVANWVEMDADQAQTLHDVLLQEKATMLDIATLPDADGDNAIDKILRAFVNPDLTETDRHVQLMAVLAMRVPGEQRNYSEVFAHANQQVMETMAQVLTPEQFDRFVQYGVQPTDIKFGDDPVDAYAAIRLPELLAELTDE